MYARRIKDKTYTFRVSGFLWGDSLVMEDRETKTHWSHILGTAMDGPLKDTELEIIPSVITSWKSWQQDHPQTTVSVFSRTDNNFHSGVYRQADLSFTVGLRHRKKIVSYPFSVLVKQPVLQDTVAGDPVLVCYDKAAGGVKIYLRKIGEETLEFQTKEGRLEAGGSHWSSTTGLAEDGPHQGKRLEELKAIISFQSAWDRFHPENRVYGD